MATSNAGAVNFSGLASGIDTNQIIEQLIEVDSQPLKRLQAQQTDLNGKKDTYTTMKSDLITLKDKVNDLKSSSAFGVFNASSSDEEALTLSATTSAREGNYTIRVLSLAQAKALSSNSYTASDTALGVSGEILVNGKGLRIRSTDSLSDISSAINSLDRGVRATILKVSDSDNRLILTSASQGAAGFRISNVGGQDVTGALGLTDGTANIREAADGKVYSSGFSSAVTTIGSLTGISANARGTVQIRDASLDLDLSADTLSSIRDKINALGLNGVTATVESSSKSGSTEYRLSLTGTEDFTDSGNVLETLGILEGGTAGVKAKFQTGDLTRFAPDKEIKNSTTLTGIGAKEGETITVSGTNSDGSAVSRSVRVTNHTKVSDLLSEIQTAFSGNVTARVEDGKITVESAAGGENPLTVKITANNTLGGTLDFGSMSTPRAGRERLVSEGRDARILVNNITVSRSSNVISDALEGVSLTLRKADPENDLVVTVERNTDGIKKKIEDFVKAYNDLADFVDKNSQFDQENKTSGPLMGDSTSRSMLSQIRGILQGTVGAEGLSYTQLMQIGVETTAEGRLKIDSEKLNKALKEDVGGVAKLLAADRSSTNSDIAFVYNSTKTKPGSYEVVITRAAEKAAVTSDAAVRGAAAEGAVTLADNFGAGFTVDYSAGASAADIANSINTEASRKYARIIQSDSALKTANGGMVSQSTVIGDIGGVTVNKGDSITVAGTDHNGRNFQRRITLGGPDTHTVGDILTAIERSADSNISASLDADGNLRIQDKTEGASKLNLTISTTVPGLSFGNFSTVQAGRNAVAVEASVTEDNRLSISHTSHGSANTVTVSGGSALGIADGVYRGKDVAGTINGVEGTGSGQSLTAATSDASSQGIVMRVNLDPEDLADAGKSKSTITLVSGIADSLYRGITALTDSVNGLVQTKLDSFDRTIKSVQDNIDNAEKRIDLRREMYVRKYSQLEKSLSLLKSTQSQLSSSLASL